MTTTITCKIPAKLNAELNALARTRRVSKSAIVREALESKTKSHPRLKVTAHDLAKHLCGRAQGGPKDLSSNPKYMKGFGE